MSEPTKKPTLWQTLASERYQELVNEKAIHVVECHITPRRENYHNSKTGRTYGVPGKGVIVVPYDKKALVPSGIFNQMMTLKENCSAKENPYVYKISVNAYYDKDGKEVDFTGIGVKTTNLPGSSDVVALDKLKDGDILGAMQALGLVKDGDIAAAANALEGSKPSKKENDKEDTCPTSEDFYMKESEKDGKWRVYKNGSDESRSERTLDTKEEAEKYIASFDIP